MLYFLLCSWVGVLGLGDGSDVEKLTLRLSEAEPGKF